MATPQGIFPAGIFFTTCSFSVSTTETSLEGPLAVYSFLPSGVSAIPQGRWPTGIVLTDRIGGGIDDRDGAAPAVGHIDSLGVR